MTTEHDVVTEDGYEVQVFPADAECGARPGVHIIVGEQGEPGYAHMHLSEVDAFTLAHGILAALLPGVRQADDDRIDGLVAALAGGA